MFPLSISIAIDAAMAALPPLPDVINLDGVQTDLGQFLGTHWGR